MAVDPGASIVAPLFSDFRCVWTSTVATQARALAKAGPAQAGAPQPATAGAPAAHPASPTLAYLLEQTVDADDVMKGSLAALLADLTELAARGGAAPDAAGAARRALHASAASALTSAKRDFLPALAAECGCGEAYEAALRTGSWSSLPGLASVADLEFGLGCVLPVDLARDLALLCRRGAVPGAADDARPVLAAALAAGDALIRRCLAASLARWARLEAARREAARTVAAAEAAAGRSPVGGWGASALAPPLPPTSPRAGAGGRPPPPSPVDPAAPLGGADAIMLYSQASAALSCSVEAAAEAAGVGDALAAVQADREAGVGWGGGGGLGGGGAAGPEEPAAVLGVRAVGAPLTLEAALEGLEVACGEGGRGVAGPGAGSAPGGGPLVVVEE